MTSRRQQAPKGNCDVHAHTDSPTSRLTIRQAQCTQGWAQTSLGNFRARVGLARTHAAQPQFYDWHSFPCPSPHCRYFVAQTITDEMAPTQAEAKPQKSGYIRGLNHGHVSCDSWAKAQKHRKSYWCEGWMGSARTKTKTKHEIESMTGKKITMMLSLSCSPKGPSNTQQDGSLWPRLRRLRASPPITTPQHTTPQSLSPNIHTNTH